MIAGGGGIGESKLTTDRTDIIDLNDAKPHFSPGPDLEKPVRYPNMVITPDDRVVITGGSTGYRGENDSNVLLCHIYDPDSGALAKMADPTVGRDYHSEALLLPDGRVATFGSDPLYDDQQNTKLGHFEQRMEIFTPPALHKNGANRPVLQDGSQVLDGSRRATYRTDHPERVTKARLMRPSAVTHTTDVEQRSIELGLTRDAHSVTVEVPKDPALVPPGWYMLFVTDADGTPSEAKWIQVK